MNTEPHTTTMMMIVDVDRPPPLVVPSRGRTRAVLGIVCYVRSMVNNKERGVRSDCVGVAVYMGACLANASARAGRGWRAGFYQLSCLCTGSSTGTLNERHCPGQCAVGTAHLSKANSPCLTQDLSARSVEHGGERDALQRRQVEGCEDEVGERLAGGRPTVSTMPGCAPRRASATSPTLTQVTAARGTTDEAAHVL